MNKQLVLPFQDLMTDRTGFVFGLPAKTGFESALADIAAVVLYKDGDWERRSARFMDNDELAMVKAPRPYWAYRTYWSDNDEDSLPRIVRLTKPIMDQGSVPLSYMKEQKGTLVYANGHRDGEPYPWDIPFALHGEAEGTRKIKLGATVIALAEFENGELMAYRPTSIAYQMKLWTSHLTRVIEILFADQKQKQYT